MNLSEIVEEQHEKEHLESSSESSDSSDDDSSSDSNSSEVESSGEESKTVDAIPTTRHEILPHRLPKVLPFPEKFKEECELIPAGAITSIVENNIVVSTGSKSTDMVAEKIYSDNPVLDVGTYLCDGERRILGPIDDVIGPVKCPFYTIRYNPDVNPEVNGWVIGTKIFYSSSQFQSVFVNKLKVKGSDASWMDDEEPPEHVVEYSDDEQEQAARSNRKRGEQGGQSGEKKKKVRKRKPRPVNYAPSQLPQMMPGFVPGFPPMQFGFPANQMPVFPPGQMPPFPPMQVPPGFPANQIPPGQMPPGFPANQMPGFPPGQMPPGFPANQMPGFPPGQMPPGFYSPY